MRSALGRVVHRHRSDIAGLAAVALGLLTAGGVWFSAAGRVGELIDTGRVGELIDTALAFVFGLVRLATPVALAAVGVAALRGRRGWQPAASRGAPGDSGEAPGAPQLRAADAAGRDTAESGLEPLTRLCFGGLLVLTAASGLLHVIRGRPGLATDDADAAGGALGVAVGGTLHAWTDVWGSMLLLLLIAAVAVIVLTQLTVRSVATAVVSVMRLIGRAVRYVFRGLAGLLFSDLSSPDGVEDASTADESDAPDNESAGASRRELPLPALADTSNDMPDWSVSVRSGMGKRPNAEGSKWRLPSLKMLSGSQRRRSDLAAVAERGKVLQATLAQFDVTTVLLDPVVGPTVTRFVLELGTGVKVSKLESLRKDIAYAMASPDVRILAPIPGQRAIGVEVPNIDRQIVALGDVLRSREAREADHPLDVAIGCDINGLSITMNLAAMPHLLIAGATGAGKSSCLNSIITSVLMRSTPDEVRMILVDPKRVEMGQYDRVPHLLTAPVTDPRKAANALAWAVREMERRYDLLHDSGFRDITGYNTAVARDELKPLPGQRGPDGEPLRHVRLPFVLVVVDELADLMMVAARDVEESIVRLAQMARAVGIHLVIATQRPSVNVITGLIKANVPARLAFAVSSSTDSRVILDKTGAERLVGRGDMLLIGPSSSAPHRVQGCWVTEAEVRAVVGHWVGQAPEFADDPSVSTEPESGSAGARGWAASRSSGGSGGSDADDALVRQAMELVVETQLGSTSMLQRKLRVGFARAGRIMDLLEQQGVVGPSLGSKAREVLISAEELEARQRGEGGLAA